MPVSEAQKKAFSKYIKENYEYCTVKVKKGKKAAIKAHADDLNESINGFINRAIDEAMARGGVKKGVSAPGDP